jgi:hypothetical protein
LNQAALAAKPKHLLRISPAASRPESRSTPAGHNNAVLVIRH